MKFDIDENGCLYNFECEDNEKHVVIPEGITAIGSETFLECINIESIIMPDSVTKIYNHAFTDCINLSEIKLSKKLKYVSGIAFQNTKWLENEGDFVIINENILCRYKGHEKNVVIPENIHYISDYAFSGNQNIERILMSDNVVDVGNDAFSYCKNLKSIKFSKNLKKSVFVCLKVVNH